MGLLRHPLRLCGRLCVLCDQKTPLKVRKGSFLLHFSLAAAALQRSNGAGEPLLGLRLGRFELPVGGAQCLLELRNVPLVGADGRVEGADLLVAVAAVRQEGAAEEVELLREGAVLGTEGLQLSFKRSLLRLQCGDAAFERRNGSVSLRLSCGPSLVHCSGRLLLLRSVVLGCGDEAFVFGAKGRELSLEGSDAALLGLGASGKSGDGLRVGASELILVGVSGLELLLKAHHLV